MNNQSGRVRTGDGDKWKSISTLGVFTKCQKSNGRVVLLTTDKFSLATDMDFKLELEIPLQVQLAAKEWQAVWLNANGMGGLATGQETGRQMRSFASCRARIQTRGSCTSNWKAVKNDASSSSREGVTQASNDSHPSDYEETMPQIVCSADMHIARRMAGVLHNSMVNTCK